MLRETTFLVGGALTIALGIALGLGLFLSGAGIEFVDAWLAAGIAVGFGAFFLHVSRDEARNRREFLRAAENGAIPPPGPGRP